jgi:hypothetical protein
MSETQHKQTGLRLGLITLSVVMIGFACLFVFGPDARPPPKQAVNVAAAPGLLDRLIDAPTRRAVEALQAASPGTYAQLQSTARQALRDEASPQDLSRLTLEALFGEFQGQALTLRSAESANFHAIISGLADGFRQLKAADSKWCDGTQIAAYLTQNDADLVPTLLAEFPYQSPQYDWAMDWMTVVLTSAKQAQDRPQQHARPGYRDEALLQQEGLALGSEQWALALQIAAFANSEGTSYAKMKEVIGGMNVCDLAMAVETVSARLPSDVQGRIWSDLMPETMLGNTPYVMWRVTDYFFIG